MDTIVWPGCRTAVRRERGGRQAKPSSRLSHGSRPEASHVDIEDDVEPDWPQSAQADGAADEAPVEEYEAESNERALDAKRQSIWKRELRFGRREAGRADDGQLERAESGHVGHPDELDQPGEAAGHGASVVDETPLPVPFPETSTPELADDTLTHDVPAEDTPARPDRRRSRLGRSRAPRTPKAPAAEKSSKSAKGGKKLVGLKIGASQIAAAYVHSNGSHEVLKLARTPLERGVVVAGELRDPDALAVALKAFFNENKLPKRNIRLGIASNRVGVRVLDVPGVEDPALLGNAVRFRAQEVLPIPLSEAVLDYRVLRERHDDEGNLIREVLVAFAYRELVDRYADVCRSAGLRLIGIDLDGFALLRALVDPSAASSRLGGAAVVTVALGHDRSIMSISNGDACEFTRVIDWGGASLDTAVARILALTPSQAEPIKRELTLDSTAPPPEGLAPDQANRAGRRWARRSVRSRASSSPRSSSTSPSPRSLDIGEIVLHRRDGAHGRPRPAATGADRASPCGSAIRSVGSSSESTPKPKRRSARSRSRSGWESRTDARGQPAPRTPSSRRIGRPSGVAVAGAAATLAAVGAVVVLSHGESVTVASRQARADDLQQQLARVPVPKTATNASGATILTSRDSRTAAVEAALDGRVPWDVLLGQVARVLPEGTWLDSMTLAAPGASTTPGVAPAAPTPGTPTPVGHRDHRIHGQCGVARTRSAAPDRSPLADRREASAVAELGTRQ